MRQFPLSLVLLAAVALALLAISSRADAHSPCVSLLGLGTATIDGVWSAAEWDGAGHVDFDVNLPVPEGETTLPKTTTGTIYAMNDHSNLYIAVQFKRSSADPGNTASVRFDNDHEGGSSSEKGDDVIVINPDLTPSFLDAVIFRGEDPCPSGSICSRSDNSDPDPAKKGSQDGAGAFANDGTYSVYEFAHPLNSKDGHHDFSLKHGDTVGFQVSVRIIDSGNNIADTYLPDHSSPMFWGDITIAYPPAAGKWSLETVDTSSGGWCDATSVALDSNGNPRISYWSGSNKTGEIKYASFFNGVWNKKTVPGTVQVGSASTSFMTSLAIDSNGNPHIIYYQPDTGELMYVKGEPNSAWDEPDSTFWHTSITVDTYTAANQYYRHHSLALDENGNPHIAYYDAEGKNLNYACCVSDCDKETSWEERVVVDSVGDNVGMYPSIAVNSSNGGVHISYYDFSSKDLKYSYHPAPCSSTAGPWTPQTLDSIGKTGAWTSIALDSDGHPHISYAHSEDAQHHFRQYLMHVEYDGEEWKDPEKVDYYHNMQRQWTSIAVDGSDNLHISHYQKADYESKLRYVYRGGTNWLPVQGTYVLGCKNRTVDWDGSGSSLAVDSAGNPHISYNKKDGALNHAWLVTHDTGTKCVSASSEATVTSDEESDGVSHSDPIDTKVVIPAESANKDTTVTITEKPPGVPPPHGDFQILTQVVDIKTHPEVTSFSSPVTITITFHSSIVPPSTDESKIQVMHWDTSTTPAKWAPVPGPSCTGKPYPCIDQWTRIKDCEATSPPPPPACSSIPKGTGEIIIKTDTLSEWALMAPGAPVGVGGITEFPVASSDSPASAAEGSGSSPAPYAAIAAAAAAALFALTAGGWYARRRLS